MKNLKDNIKEFKVIAVFLFLSFFSLNWFHGREFILAGDLGWPIFFKRFFELTFYVWDSSVAPGYLSIRQLVSFFPFATYGYLFDLLGFSSSFFQKFSYLISFFFSGYGTYLFMRGFNLNRLSAFVSGLFYMLSPYALIVAWNPAYGQTFPFYAYLPLVLFFYLKYIKSSFLLSKELFVGLLLTFISFIGASFSNPAFFIMLIACFILLSIFFCINNSYMGIIYICRKTIVYIFLYILLNMFWIFPLLFNINTTFSGADNSIIGVIGDYETQHINSVIYYDVFKLSGLWTMHAKHLGDYYYTFHEFWNSSFYIITSYIFMGTVIYLYSKTSNKKYSYLFLILLLIFLLTAGLRGNRLFKNITELAYLTPYIGRIFRSVYLKFGSLLILVFTMLLGLLINKLKTTHLSILLIVIIVLHGFPFFTGSLIKNIGSRTPAHTVTIPDDYYKVSDYINNDSSTFKVLVLPIPVGYNFHLRWGISGYNGAEFLRTMINKPLYYVGGLPYVNYLANELNPSILGEANVKYIIVRKDIYKDNLLKGYLTKSWDDISNLTNSSGVKKVLETDNLYLYEISSDLIKPLFYTLNSKDLVYFEKVNPTKFKVAIATLDKETTLFFNEGLNSAWSINKSDNKSSYYIIKDVKSEFINSWYLSGSNTYELVIEHSIQKYFYIGLCITLFIVLGFILVLTRYLWLPLYRRIFNVGK